MSGMEVGFDLLTILLVMLGCVGFAYLKASQNALDAIMQVDRCCMEKDGKNEQLKK